MKLRGGEFSTGTTGNFQPELTGETEEGLMRETGVEKPA